MLAGAYVPSWQEVGVTHSVIPEDVEGFIEEAAAKAGLDTDKPFPFLLEGELTDVHLHVMHGACPMHARLNKIELPKELSPVEEEHVQMRGIVVGIFAQDAMATSQIPQRRRTPT